MWLHEGLLFQACLVYPLSYCSGARYRHKRDQLYGRWFQPEPQDNLTVLDHESIQYSHLRRRRKCTSLWITGANFRGHLIIFTCPELHLGRLVALKSFWGIPYADIFCHSESVYVVECSRIYTKHLLGSHNAALVFNTSCAFGRCTLTNALSAFVLSHFAIK